MAFLEILHRPTVREIVLGIVQILGPVWLAFFLGIMMGWAWKPRWARPWHCKLDISAPSSPSSPDVPSLDSCKASTPDSASSAMDKERTSSPAIDEAIKCSSSEDGKEDNEFVASKDLQYLCNLVERKDGGPSWKHMMDRSTQDMIYQAWQRDPEIGPPQYCSRTVYEDATPELLRDFFWDDEFRLKWDNMLLHTEVLKDCPATGTMVVHWIRKFPFFCSDREYIIGRRIWESGRSYYCVTKGVLNESIPRKEKPRRVDLYYSSWHIRAVESTRKGNGKLSACEVMLFHYEDMGIPWEIAKFGVRQGMWGTVKNIGRGFRAYQKHRATKASLSHHALMAQINTKLDLDCFNTMEGGEVESACESHGLMPADADSRQGPNIRKLVVVGMIVAVACSLDKGLLTKSAIFGLARKFGNLGRRACPRTN